MKKTIRLTENDLHNLIRKSVTKILKEAYGFAPDGRQINQQKAIQAANAQTSWKAYMDRAKFQNPKMVDKAQQQFKNQYMDGQNGYVNNQVNQDVNSSYYGRVTPYLGSTRYYQDSTSNPSNNVAQMYDKNINYDPKVYSTKNMNNMTNDDNYNTFKKMTTDVHDYYTNNYANRMRQKRQQLGNKGIYESNNKIRH